MDLIFSKIFIGFTAIATIFSSILFPAQIIQPQSFGVVIPVPIASFTTSLASKIGIADTTLTLVSTTTDDGTSLINGTVYGFVLDVGTSNEEYILGTASSSNAIVSITRGISVVTGNTSVAALARKHGRGASVKITDAPVLLVLARILNGNETIPNALSYSSASSTFITSNAQLTNKAYVDSVTVSAGTLWLSLGNNIYNSNSGNVGVGTTTPATKLYVSGSSTISGNEIIGGNLNVSGTSNLAVTNITKTMNVSGGVTFTGGVTSTGELVVNNNLTVTGNSNLATTTITNLTLSGNLSLTSAMQVKVFTTSTTWTVPAGITTIYITLLGGGGGGGGSCSAHPGSYTEATGASGASGGYASDMATTTIPGQIITITIGSGGLPGAGSATIASAGTEGTTTTVATFSVSGGGGGKASISSCGTDSLPADAVAGLAPIIGFGVAGNNGISVLGGDPLSYYPGANSNPHIGGIAALGVENAAGTTSLGSHGIGASGGGSYKNTYWPGGVGSSGYAIIKW